MIDRTSFFVFNKSSYYWVPIKKIVLLTPEVDADGGRAKPAIGLCDEAEREGIPLHCDWNHSVHLSLY